MVKAVRKRLRLIKSKRYTTRKYTPKRTMSKTNYRRRPTRYLRRTKRISKYSKVRKPKTYSRKRYVKPKYGKRVAKRATKTKYNNTRFVTSVLKTNVALTSSQLSAVINQGRISQADVKNSLDILSKQGLDISAAFVTLKSMLYSKVFKSATAPSMDPIQLDTNIISSKIKFDFTSKDAAAVVDFFSPLNLTPSSFNLLAGYLNCNSIGDILTDFGKNTIFLQLRTANHPKGWLVKASTFAEAYLEGARPVEGYSAIIADYELLKAKPNSVLIIMTIDDKYYRVIIDNINMSRSALHIHETLMNTYLSKIEQASVFTDYVTANLITNAYKKLKPGSRNEQLEKILWPLSVEDQKSFKLMLVSASACRDYLGSVDSTVFEKPSFGVYIKSYIERESTSLSLDLFKPLQVLISNKILSIRVVNGINYNMASNYNSSHGTIVVGLKNTTFDVTQLVKFDVNQVSKFFNSVKNIPQKVGELDPSFLSFVRKHCKINVSAYMDKTECLLDNSLNI